MSKYKAIHYSITNKRHATTNRHQCQCSKTFGNYGLQTFLFITMSRKMLGIKMESEK